MVYIRRCDRTYQPRFFSAYNSGATPANHGRVNPKTPKEEGIPRRQSKLPASRLARFKSVSEMSECYSKTQTTLNMKVKHNSFIAPLHMLMSFAQLN
jgi:hypothetical protein